MVERADDANIAALGCEPVDKMSQRSVAHHREHAQLSIRCPAPRVAEERDALLLRQPSHEDNAHRLLRPTPGSGTLLGFTAIFSLGTPRSSRCAARSSVSAMKRLTWAKVGRLTARLVAITTDCGSEPR